MRITHINTNDTGGAGKACMRLHTALNNMDGITSNLLTLHKKTDAAHVSIYKPSKKEQLMDFFIRATHRLKLLPGRNRNNTFSFPDSGYRIETNPLCQEADIINLHWTAFFLNYKSFFKKTNKKIVWTLHDMGPFSSGSHYTEPSHVRPETERKIFETKRAALKNPDINMTIVCPSKWLLEKSKASELFKGFPHVHIPNGVDSNIFKSYDRQSTRKGLGIDPEAKVILFVAESTADPRKGFHHLITALQNLKRKNEVTLCVVGATDSAATKEFKHVHSFGYVRDEEKLAKIYSCADIFVIPSIEDNLPNTMLESLMCGIPVVGFRVGGIGETIVQNLNGMTTDSITSESLTEILDRALQTKFDHQTIRNQAKNLYDVTIMAKNYAELYRTILKNS